MIKKLLRKIYDRINITMDDVSRIIPDKLYLKILYKIKTKQNLNLDNPQTFNEKLQWLKLNNKNPEYTKMVDKYEVKKYVSDICGKEYIIPTLGVYDKFKDIDFDKLPNQFVLKCTHDSGGVVICKDKKTFDYVKARKTLNFSLRRNYFYYSREWPYKNVKRRILVEKYMEDKNNEDLIDYKIMCFNGKPRCSFTCTNRRSKEGLNVDFYDIDWNRMPFERHYKSSNIVLEKPRNYDLMIKFAEKLSKGTKFLRVDFYEIEGKLYFGELTFFPGGGLEEFRPEEWDKKLGDWIKLD